MGPFLFDRKDESMKQKYKIRIVTKHLIADFVIESEKEIKDVKDLHKDIIDFIGKNDITWVNNPLKFTGGFYITYEEVNDGGGQNVAVRQETETRVEVERAVS